MERLTEKREYPLAMSMWGGNSKDLNVYNRLAKIEDILGDDYDLSRIRDLVQADKEGRCVVHGEWLCAETDDEQFFLCSVCNDKEYWESNYCPNCGAKMDVEQEE